MTGIAAGFCQQQCIAATWDCRVNPLSDSRGFTLVEIFVAMLIFFLGIVPFLNLQLFTVGSNSAANQLTAATNLAESKMEELLGMPYELFVALAEEKKLDDVEEIDAFSRNWIPDMDKPINNTTTITVTVSWTDKDNLSHSVSLQSIKGKCSI